MPESVKKAVEIKKPAAGTKKTIQKKVVNKNPVAAKPTTEKTTTTTPAEDAKPKLTQGQKLLKSMTAQRAAMKALMKGVTNTKVSFDEDGNEASVETVVKKIEKPKPTTPVKTNKNRPAMKKPEPKKRKASEVDDKEEDKKEEAEEKVEKKTNDNKKPPKRAKKAKKSKAEVEEMKKDNKQEEALAYVRLFVNDRDSWKFKKVQQIWLLSNLYEIPEDEFDNVLEYLKDLQGSAREKVKKEAEEKIPKKTAPAPAPISNTLTGYATVNGVNDDDDFDAEKLLAQATFAPAPAVVEEAEEEEEEEEEEEDDEIKRAKLIVKVLSS